MNPFIICNQRRSKKTTFNDELFENTLIMKIL